MSRELDADVAVQLFGWVRRTTECNNEQLLTVPADWTDLRLARWLGHDVNELVPHFSTDIADAWQVVERFVDLGGNMTVCQYPKGASAQVWVPGVAFGFVPTRVIQAETAPEAICHAALAAVGQEVVR